MPGPRFAVIALLAPLASCGRLGFGDQACRTTDDPIPAGAYYVALDGDDGADGTGPDTAWATVAHAWTALAPGDTLIVRDGTYPAMDVAVSGTPELPITVRAEHDGGAIFDGGNTATACRIAGDSTTRRTDLELIGVRCRHGDGSVLAIARADRITVRRVTADDSGPVINNDVIQVYIAADILLEDVAAWGRATTSIAVIDSDRVTVRRAYAHWESSLDSYNQVLALSGARDSIVENAIVSAAPGTNQAGFSIGSPTYYQSADRNRVLGSVAIGITSYAFIVSTDVVAFAGNTIADSVAIASRTMAVYQRGDADLSIDQLTAVGWTTDGYVLEAMGLEPKDPGYAIGAHISRSVFGSGPIGLVLDPTTYLSKYVHDHNDLFAIDQPHRGDSVADPTEVAIDPGFDVDRYGNGAYLIRPAVGDGTLGAEVLYRTVDGEVTDVPLWPWPMETRIADELGVSVTWESGGGIWRAPPPVRCF